MQLTARVLSLVVKPAKVHFGIYAEQVKHIHVFPRRPGMSPGNIPNFWIVQWIDMLHALGLKKPYSHEVVAEYAETLRRTYLEFEN